jgi:predicted N-acetyltransferase YhbS
MRIDYLSRHPHFLPTLAEWMYQEWFQDMDLTLEHAVNQLHQRLHQHELPLTLVAFTHEPLGMVSIFEDVPSVGYQLIPCLTGLYVVPGRRRRGVGARLCQRALLEAQRLGHAGLSLYTHDHEAFYSHLGWVKRSETVVQTGQTHQIAAFMEYGAFAQLDVASMGEDSNSPVMSRPQ